jgi:hypothetical protein
VSGCGCERSPLISHRNRTKIKYVIRTIYTSVFAFVASESDKWLVRSIVGVVAAVGDGEDGT